MSIKVDMIPGELRERDQWVLWKTTERHGKPTKVPFQVNGQEAKSNDPETWTTFDAAVKRYQVGGYDGVGYVFSHYDEFTGIDLDGCRNPETGDVTHWAREVIQRVDTYSELSPSLTGIKLFARGKSPFEKGKKTGVKAEPVCDKAPGIEIYSALRYFTVTGLRLAGVPATCEPRELAWLRERFWPSDNGKRKRNRPPSPSSTPIIERARKYVAKMPSAVSGQGGSDRTFAVACALRLGFELSEDEAMPIMREYSARCEPPWSEQDLLHKVQDAAEQTGDRGYLRDAELPGNEGNGRGTSTERFRLTDMGNGQRLAKLHGADLRYCWPWGKWLVWDGRRWKIDDVGGIAARAKATVRSIYREASGSEEDSERKAIATWARQSEKRERISAMVDLARSEPRIPVLPDQLDRDPWALNCANGTLDLRTAKLRPHDRADYLTKLAPVAYEPSAECPRWDNFLGDIFNASAELVGFLQRLLGYCLTGDVTEHVLPIFYGTGANGKSTLVSTLLEMLGPDYAMKAPPDFLVAKRDEAHPTGLADLAGKRLVACVETDEGKRLAESLVKELCGGDAVRARRMREDFWQFDPTHKVILATNHRPAVKGTDYAIWRRLRLVPFNVVIAPEQRDKRLLEKLRGELPGILAWCVRGCLEWQRDGLREPGDVLAATDAYRSEEDLVGVFLAECCEQTPDTWEPAKTLYAAYRKHCEDSGEHPVGQRRFGRAMSERGFERFTRDGTCYRGIRVRGE